MAIKELFQDSRPSVLFDPRASQRIDPRFKFTRDGAATYVDEVGVLRYAPANQPRLDYDPVTGEIAGLLLESQRTNSVTYSSDFDNAVWTKAIYTGSETIVDANTATAPDGTLSADKVTITSTDVAHDARRLYYRSGYPATGVPTTISIYAKKGNADYFAFVNSNGFGGYSQQITVNLTTLEVPYFNAHPVQGVSAYSVESAGNEWVRVSISVASNQCSVISCLFNNSSTLSVRPGTSFGYLWGLQVEDGFSLTSHIPTGSSTVTRAADLLSIEGTSLPSTGSIYIDARSLSSNVNDTLLSAANASNDKLTLAIRQPASLYNSKALVYEVDGAFKPTLPFPVPSVARERNLITYGANNYHYRSDSARYTPSSSTSVPAGMNRLGIGHDVTDPTKAITGYINTVYLWPGEITPTVAEALVRGDVDPKDADAGTFTPEAGALAFVFNTQGTGTDGNRVVELPFGGSTNNVLVDWGDNTSSSFIGAAASSTVSHTYPSAGIYPVQITADDDGTNSGLQTLTFYNSSQRLDLVRVLQWGGSTTWQPTTMYRAFRDCTQLDFENAARTNLPDTSAITNWQEAFYNCSSISGTFPTFDTSAATTFSNTWRGCSSLTAFPFISSSNVTSFASAWYGCSSLTSFPLIDTSSCSSFGASWQLCSGLTSFPLINTAAATNLSSTWESCSNLASFPLINTATVTNFSRAWYGCSSLTSFPLINTAAGTNFYLAWYGCSSLTSFGPTNFSNATTLESAFSGWTAYTGSFPAITTSASLTSLWGAWQGNKMTSFTPPTNTSQVTTLRDTFNGCTGLTGTFPTMDTANVTSFLQTWTACSELTGFPALNTSNVTDFYRAWSGCSGLTSFPTIDTSKGTRFLSAWTSCSFTSFPALDFSLGTDFGSAWDGCDLTAFPAVTFPAATTFAYAWRYNPITDFPAGAFDSTGTLIAGAFVQTFLGCALTAASIENILVSLDTNGATGVTLTLSGGTNAAKSTWTSAANTAYTNLIGKGWSITYNA